MTFGLVREFVRHNLADPLYRQSLYTLGSAGVSAVTGLLFWVIAAHRQRPEILGVAAGLVAANAFLSYLTSLALPYAMLRFGGVNRPVSAMLNWSLAVSAATSLAAAGCFALVAPLSSPALADALSQPGSVALFGLAGVGAAMGVLLDNLLAARRRGGVALARNTAAGVLKLVPLAVVGSEDARGLFLAATLPALVTAVAVVAVLPRLISGYRWSDVGLTPEVREVAGFAVRAFPASLLSGAPQFALPLIAVSVLAAGEYAFFYIAWSIAQILYLVPSVVANIALSEGASRAPGTVVARARRFSLLLLAPAAVAGVLLAGVILELYGGEYVRGAAQPLRLMVLAALPWTIVIMAQSQLRAEDRFRALTLVTGAFCVVSLTAPLVAGVAGGVRAMAAGWLGAVAVTAVLAWRQTARSRPGSGSDSRAAGSGSGSAGSGSAGSGSAGSGSGSAGSGSAGSGSAGSGPRAAGSGSGSAGSGSAGSGSAGSGSGPGSAGSDSRAAGSASGSAGSASGRASRVRPA